MESVPSSAAYRSSLSRQARNYLLSKIAEGGLVPGDRVIEARVAEELHISAIPVREAIRELAAIRVLDYTVHKGARVREGSVSETIDALRIKASLEELAVGLAGERLAARLPELRSQVAATLAAAQRRDWVDHQAQNQRFHQIIVEASGNDILLHLWESLAFDVRTLFIMDLLKDEEPEDLLAEHAQVVDAIRHGDLARAGRLLSDHANMLADKLMRVSSLIG